MKPSNRWQTALRIAALGAVLALAGCGDLIDPDDSIEGIYNLLLVNGENPPVVIYNGVEDGTNVKVAVTDGSLTLSGGEFEWQIVLDVTWDGGSIPSDPITDSGRYEVDGATVRFLTASGEEKGFGLIEGREITIQDSHPDYGMVTLVFRRR